VLLVCSWLGKSPRIAQRSYLLVTEDDFAKAAGVAKVMDGNRQSQSCHPAEHRWYAKQLL
jgi:hypothetical protein